MTAEEFLAHIARQLGRPTPALPARDVVGAPPFYPGAHAGPLAERFAAELTRVGGVVHRCVASAAADTVRRVLEQLAARRVVAYAPVEFAGLGLDALWPGLAVTTPEAPDFRARAALADVGITTVDAAVAETGSLLLGAAPTRPRVASLLPTVHLAVVRESQLCTRLTEAWARLPALPSAAVLVTGPSRTSDIENDLTIGVHGPAAVHMVLVAGR